MKIAIVLLLATSVSAQPVSAAGDLAKDAAAKAALEITNYDINIDTDAKTLAKYSEMDAAAKTVYDTARKVITDARTKRDADEKTATGYATMTLEQKTQYDASLLAFKKTTYKACKEAATGFDCANADSLRKSQEDKRVTDGYYKLASASLKSDWDTKWVAEDTKLRATLTAAAADKKKTDDAAEAKRLRKTGESCKADATSKVAPKCLETHCCGTAKIAGKTTGSIVSICNTKAAKDYTKGTQKYEFACATAGAMSLIASASAALAASYML